MKVKRSITIDYEDLKKIIANHFKNIKNSEVSFSTKENYWGEVVSVSATISYTDEIEETEE